MRKVVSFRLDELAIKEARRQAKRRRLRFTRYLEAAVLDDLKQGDAIRSEASATPLMIRVLRVLRDHREELARLGVRHAWIIGSVARGEDRPDSDVDIAVDIDPQLVRDLFAYSRVRRTLEAVVGRPVDIARRDRLRPGVAQAMERDGVVAF